MFKKIAHIGIAVKDLEQACQLFGKLFSLKTAHSETVNDQKVKIAMFQIGETKVELTQATDPSSAIAKFIQRRGEGVHHISFEVDDIEKELRRLKASGFQLIHDQPKLGADGYYVAFLHPKSTNGVLVELSQKKR